METQKLKKQVSGLIKKYFNKNSRCLLKQKSYNYSRFFLPFIIIITAIVFANILGNDFIDNWDDDVYILKNETIKHLNWENLKEIFSTFYHANYHPLTTLSYAIEYNLFGLNPFPFHLTNYILHLLNALLVYLFLKRFTGKPWVAAIASLFFAVHPMHVESVAWISERKDVLYTFFFLLSLNSYSKYLVTEKKNSYIVWSFFWFLLSLMSKSAAVCLPVVLVLMDFYHHKKLSWQSLASKIPFFALALLFGILAVFSQKSSGAIIDLSWFFSISDRVFLASYSSVYYLFKVFAPFNLSALYFYPIKSGNMLPIEYYLTLPVLILLIWGVFKSGRFKHELIFGLLFYFITIVMVLKIISFGGAIVAERYSYVPYIGIFFIFGQFFSYVKDNEFSFSGKIKYIVSFVLVIFTVLYSFLTYERNKVWKNGIVLFTDIIEKGRLIPEQRLADTLETSKTDSFGMSLYNFNMTIANNNLGSAYGYVKDWDNGIKYCQIAIKFDPNFQLAKNNLNWFLDEKAKQQLPDALKTSKADSALVKLQAAIDLAKSFPNETNYINLSLAYYNNGKYSECVAAAQKALEYNAKSYAAYNNMCCSYNQLGMWNEAIVAGKNAIAIIPGDQLATNNLQASFDGKKKQDKDVADAEALVKTNPNENNYLSLGYAYYNARKFELAIASYQKVLAINSKNVVAYNNICSAYNELGKWKKAAENCEKALKIDSTYTLSKNNLKVAQDNLKK